MRIVCAKCRKAGIKLSARKLEVGNRVKFAGFIVSDKGVVPDPAKTEAIRRFPRPTNLTELRSFLGLCNQLGAFLPDLAQLTQDIRALNKKNRAFVWTDVQEKSFRVTKAALTSPMVVKAYDPDLPTILYTDASRKGIGYCLVQRAEGANNLRLIHCGSQALTQCQANYAVIELEAMAIMWAIEKCKFYLRGCPHFTVVTDHAPLRQIFRQPLYELTNARLLRFREKLVDYQFEVEWQAGKLNEIADALSRYPVWPAKEETSAEADADLAVVVNRVAEDPAMQVLYDYAAEDDEYGMLIDALHNQLDRVAIRDLPLAVSRYSAVWDRLSTLDDQQETLVLLDASRVVVPQSARSCLLYTSPSPRDLSTSRMPSSA